GGGSGPVTRLHYAPNNNFDSSGHYMPGPMGFNLADVGSVSELDSLPNGVKGLVWLGLCNGADSSFINAVQPFIGNPKLFGFYLMDEPDPTGQWAPLCPAGQLMAESDWIHAHVPGAKTFIVMMNFDTSTAPTYMNTYNPGNSHIDLYGLDPYPCRTETNGCDYSMINHAVTAAQAAGIPVGSMVPVYQAFGGGGWSDDGGGQYTLPTASQEQQIMSTWAPLVPNPVFDYAYSWGTQNSDQALEGSTALQAVFEAHNDDLDSSGHYMPGPMGFNLADVSSVSELNSLPSGVKGLVWLGLCNGADSSFINAVQPFIGNPKLFGFYLMDEPDPTGQWAPLCPAGQLMAESDWIHAHVPGAKTFIVMMNFDTSTAPTYMNTYNPGNSHLNL